MKVPVVCLCATIFIGCLMIIQDASATKAVMGWIEKVELMDSQLNLVLKAKLDTGAKSSSLHARNIKYFNKDDGSIWVRFDFGWHKSNAHIDTIHVEYPVKDHVLIKHHVIDPRDRPVISLKVCIDHTPHVMDVNLINRSRLNYPMLIGRDVLKGNYIVDSEQTFTTHPKCG